MEFRQEPESGRWGQRGKPRQPVHLAKIPVVLFTAQASYHATYDWATFYYLQEAGVKVEHIWLKEHGLEGNGHMMMLEKNSDRIVELVERFMLDNFKVE